MTYAFTFDASACTGCKACQIACKDKNNLPTGVLWRRVYEISGGSWEKQNEAWITDVFAYNLSLACNHCVHPKCAGVCPTDAYAIREDGIVTIDESRCMGCGYCNWACPYSVPEYNPEMHQMTKCNFCYDNIDAGLPPACVAACPMRVLDFVTVNEGWVTNDSEKALWELPATEHPFPLPNFSNTEPHIAIAPHAAMDRGGEARIANQEEVHPQGVRLFAEIPLIAFTLLGQMAVGMTIALAMMEIAVSTFPALMVSLGLAFTATLVAFLHLGKPVNARYALRHWQKSWLSREILALGLFGLSGAATATLYWFGISAWLIWLTAAFGIGLVISMAQVYRLRTMPAWDYQRTLAAFFLSAGLLGLQAVNLAAPLGWMGWVLPLLFAGELVLALSGRKDYDKPVSKLRIGMIAAGLMAGLTLSILPEPALLLSIPLFLLSIIEEIIGRWCFYEMLKERPL